ncbi:peptide MFS transporter [Mammaliicoccus stepanovicii]|uniref:Di-tripeptide ABC transporter n=1 Tax=Mammaliicoccus stepanovicii TaxID=643214 RepID=A0A239Y946_9STAP|nr:peptide MFS transporter [Mammaliicoccus stepanovicii]PNZ77054.1 MFS transporter [Mammaliicoccus stepanovicii]GGI43004.1 MFS transporter [Mammaliicoccus stepanovicii]SNV55210.1 di-tripeptide ABC transporter [Mammaliicoccus stepanovicii]
MSKMTREEMVESVPQHGFFGHPRGLGILFFVEFWERFSYYGMRAILLYYLYFTVTQGGLGLDKVTAQQIMAMYGSLIFMTGILGGWVADRLFGSRRSLMYGAILIMAGHIVLSLPFGLGAFLVSMILIIIGSGLMKPNISNVVGGLYHKNDSRLDAGFVIFYMSVNMGALLSPLIIDKVRLNIGFHEGFSIAAFGMFLAVIAYLFFQKRNLGEVENHPSNPLNTEEKKKYTKIFTYSAILIIILLSILYFIGQLTFNSISLIVLVLGIIIPIVYWLIMYKSPDIDKVEKGRLLAYVPLFLAGVLFWSIQEQGSNVLGVFAEDSTQLDLNAYGINFVIPAGWFQSINPIFIVMFAPVISFLWQKLGRFNPSTPLKFVIGLTLAGLSFIVMMIAMELQTTELMNPIWLVLSFFICVIGELCLSPTGSSVSVKLAPSAFSAQMLSLWFLTNATAQGINGQLVKLIEPLGQKYYFGLIGAIAIVVAIIVLTLTPKIKKLMQGIH